MNLEEIESYLTTIEEYVFDEKKIVTFSWLSRTLGIHTNVSKQLLNTFLENNQKKEELCATYLLIGSPKNNETCQVLIVKDKDLPEVEDSLSSITSKHIYSVQRCSELSNVDVLYAAQKGESLDTITKGISAIDFNCKERDSGLLEKLKFNALPVTSNQSKGVVKKVNPQPSNQTKSPVKSVNNVQVKTSKSPDKNKESDSKTDNKKAMIPSMFKNSTATGPKKKPVEKVTVNTKKPAGIGAFFSKTTSKSNNEPKKEAENEKAKEEKEKEKESIIERLSPLKENKATLNICDDNKSAIKVNDISQKSPMEPTKSDSKKTTSKKAGAKRSKKEPVKKVKKEEKKRKRLVVMSDSDSSNNSEDEEEIKREPTPEPEPTVIPDNSEIDDIVCGTPEPSSRKRKRKLVSKTCVSSEGYMTTQKEYVDASCSEDEEAVHEKKFKETSPQDNNVAKPSCSVTEKNTAGCSPKEKNNSSKNKNPSPAKTKQASLMSFFKKK